VAKSNHDLSQFGSAKPANTGGSQHCAQCEAMLADALDGTLSAAEQAQFDLHMAGCPTCSQMLADAQRGAAWLELLRTPRLEPPAALLERILAQTARQAALTEPHHLSILPASLPTVVEGVPTLRTATILPFRSRLAAKLHLSSMGHTMLQPRLAMTAAMAFFSIGLTLNLTGVRLNELHASDLKPANVKRSFYQANAHVVRYVDNLRAVYELESRVRDLQRSNDNDSSAIPESSGPRPSNDTKPDSKDGQPEQKQPRPRPGSGTSQRQSPLSPLGSPSLRLVVDRVVSPPQRLVPVSVVAVSTPKKGELV